MLCCLDCAIAGPSVELASVQPSLRHMFSQFYNELLDVAHKQTYGKTTTLTRTALVHECFERMQQAGCEARERTHFLGYAARTMRSVVVDDMRRKLSQRRGDGAVHLPFQESIDAEHADEDTRRVHDALAALQQHDPRLRRIVDLRFFAGLDDKEIGQALGVSVRTVQREWDKARRMLQALIVDE
jgi:RNA polymerase sigma factor (TIGR02999 family)